MQDLLHRYVVAIIVACPFLAIPAVVWASEPPPAPTGYGYLLLRMTLMLAVVCALAVVSLRWGLKRFVPSSTGDNALEVVARLHLEPRRSLLVVRVATRHLLIGTSEAGLTSLGELSPEEVGCFEENRPTKKV